MSVALVAKQVHLSGATVERLAQQGSKLSSDAVKAALLEAKRPAGPKEVAAVRASILALASAQVEQQGEGSKELRAAIDGKDTQLTHGGKSAKSSPAYSRLKVDPEAQKKAKDLADGELLRFLSRRDLDANEVKGPLLAEAVKELNANIRTTGGKPAFPESVVSMAVAMLAQRGVSFAGRAKEGALPALDAFAKDPAGAAGMLARILTRAVWQQHTFPMNDPDGRGVWDMPSNLNVWVEHRGFRAGLLELLGRLAAGEKLSDGDLDAKLKALAKQTSAEYKKLLEPANQYNQPLYEELRGTHAKSEPRQTGFAHALKGLIIEAAVDSLRTPGGAKAFASYLNDAAGTPTFSQNRQKQFLKELFG